MPDLIGYLSFTLLLDTILVPKSNGRRDNMPNRDDLGSAEEAELQKSRNPGPNPATPHNIEYRFPQLTELSDESQAKHDPGSGLPVIVHDTPPPHSIDYI